MIKKAGLSCKVRLFLWFRKKLYTGFITRYVPFLPLADTESPVQ